MIAVSRQERNEPDFRLECPSAGQARPLTNCHCREENRPAIIRPPSFLVPELLDMSSLQTFFRTVVMLATLGIVAKVWFLYGPSAVELQTIGVRIVELSKDAINNYWKSPNSGTSLAGDSSSPLQPAPFVPPSSPMQPIPLPPVASVATGSVQLANSTTAPSTPVAPPLSPAAPALAAPPSGAKLEPMASAAGTDRLVTDVAQLANLGVHNQQVKPWGNGGGLYRCTCDAPWTASPNYSRHFEAVATTAEAAVEQVTAQVTAWQNSQRRATAGR
jgi:hypothetical protein